MLLCSDLLKLIFKRKPESDSTAIKKVGVKSPLALFKNWRHLGRRDKHVTGGTHGDQKGLLVLMNE